jgi:hypothetical protein
MAYNRFLLNQLLPAGNNKTIYELILDEPYSAGRKPSDAADSLAAKTPADVGVGSKATYITEDANGNRVVWKFTYQQTAVDETGWVITKVLEGGMAPIPLEVTVNAKYEGNGATAYTPVDVDVPNPSTGTLQITENGEGINVSSYAYVDVNVSGGLTTATVTISGEKNYCQADISPVLDPITEVSDIIQAVYVVEESLYKCQYAWTEEEVAEGVTAEFLMLTPSFPLHVSYDSDNPNNITITGDAVLAQDDPNSVIISGDCTIHLVGWDE